MNQNQLLWLAKWHELEQDTIRGFGRFADSMLMKRELLVRGQAAGLSLEQVAANVDLTPEQLARVACLVKPHKYTTRSELVYAAFLVVCRDKRRLQLLDDATDDPEKTLRMLGPSGMVTRAVNEWVAIRSRKRAVPAKLPEYLLRARLGTEIDQNTIPGLVAQLSWVFSWEDQADAQLAHILHRYSGRILGPGLCEEIAVDTVARLRPKAVPPAF